MVRFYYISPGTGQTHDSVKCSIMSAVRGVFVQSFTENISDLVKKGAIKTKFIILTAAHVTAVSLYHILK